MSIFEVIDKTGRVIRLTGKQWKHILIKRPFISKYLEEIIETLRKTDKIIRTGNKAYYYKNYKYFPSPNQFMLVIIRYLNGDGFVITAHLTSKIK